MRGLYNGEIRDRTHIFEIFFSLLAFGIITTIPFLGAYNLLFRSDDSQMVKGLISLGVGIFFLWFFLIIFGREFIFFKLNKNKVSVKRPLLRLSPFRKDRVLREIETAEIGEIKITRPTRGTPLWRFISKEGETLLKFRFAPEFIFSTVELDDYFKQNGIDIKLTTA
jgi:hypothetical protein